MQLRSPCGAWAVQGLSARVRQGEPGEHSSPPCAIHTSWHCASRCRETLIDTATHVQAMLGLILLTVAWSYAAHVYGHASVFTWFVRYLLAVSVPQPRSSRLTSPFRQAVGIFVLYTLLMYSHNIFERAVGHYRACELPSGGVELTGVVLSQGSESRTMRFAMHVRGTRQRRGADERGDSAPLSALPLICTFEGGHHALCEHCLLSGGGEYPGGVLWSAASNGLCKCTDRRRGAQR